MSKKTDNRRAASRNAPRQPIAVSGEEDVDGLKPTVQVSPGELVGRRSFLKQAGVFSAGLVSGPALLQGCGGGGGAQAAVSSQTPSVTLDPEPIADPASPDANPEPISDPVPSGSDPEPIGDPVPPPDIPQSAESLPVLRFNDAAVSHLLSIDLRSESNLLALNDTYGAGTYTPSGNLVFDAHRGVEATDESSGLEIDLSKILNLDERLGLAVEGQLTVELESNRIADPWLLDTYTDRYRLRGDVSRFPASAGLPPFPQKATLWRMVGEDHVGGPFIQGPQPESPAGLGTRANNLSVRLHDHSLQDMRIGIHTAMHKQFTAVTTAWWASSSFTVYIDGVPQFLVGPAAVGSNGAQVEQAAYMMTDVQANIAPKRLVRLFFGRSGVCVRRLILGSRAPLLPVHPLFRECASYGDSFTHRGGAAGSRLPVPDLWDAARFYYFMRNLAQYGYRSGWCWNNSLGGGSHLKTANRSLWDNGGRSDLQSLKDVNPSFVMMAASHNDAFYVGRGSKPGTTGYQRRLSEIKQDFLEHVEVILTGQSQNWNKTSLAGDAKIGIISAPISPRLPEGWEENQAQAQRDLNAFVLHEVPDWVRANLGESYYTRIATYDAAALFGPQHLVDYHPLFEKNGTGTHPNWWGNELMDFGWWQCVLKLIYNQQY